MDNDGQEAVIQSQQLSSTTADLRDQYCASQNLNSLYSDQIHELQQQVDELTTTNDANEEELGYLRHRNFQLQQEMQQLITAHSEEIAARYPLLLSWIDYAVLFLFRQHSYEINLEIERNRTRRLQQPPRSFQRSPFQWLRWRLRLLECLVCSCLCFHTSFLDSRVVWLLIFSLVTLLHVYHIVFPLTRWVSFVMSSHSSCLLTYSVSICDWSFVTFCFPVLRRFRTETWDMFLGKGRFTQRLWSLQTMVSKISIAETKRKF